MDFTTITEEQKIAMENARIIEMNYITEAAAFDIGIKDPNRKEKAIHCIHKSGEITKFKYNHKTGKCFINDNEVPYPYWTNKLLHKAYLGYEIKIV